MNKAGQEAFQAVLEREGTLEEAQKKGLLSPESRSVVFVVEGERAVERSVKTGIAMGQDRQVLSGLAAGETVVLDAPETLQDGDTVRLAGAGDTE